MCKIVFVQKSLLVQFCPLVQKCLRAILTRPWAGNKTHAKLTLRAKISPRAKVNLRAILTTSVLSSCNFVLSCKLVFVQFFVFVQFCPLVQFFTLAQFRQQPKNITFYLNILFVKILRK